MFKVEQERHVIVPDQAASAALRNGAFAKIAGELPVCDDYSFRHFCYTPRLNKHAASLIAEWVDAVLFANKKFRVTKDASDRAIAAPIGADGGERIIRTVGSPACIAKNRYGLPGEIPLSWAAFIKAYQQTLEKNHGQMQ